MKPTRRIRKPFTVEVRRSGRLSAAAAIDKQPDWPELAAEPAEPPQELADPAPAAITPTGRVLPALDDPAPVVVPAERRIVQRRRAKKAIGMLTAAEEADERAVRAEIAAEIAADPTPAQEAAEPPAQHRLPRLPRSAYPRGERWKARLPALCHQMSGR